MADAATDTNNNSKLVAIDLNCIAIKINGKPNDTDNARCSANSSTEDGFVYSSITKLAEDGTTFQYDYGVEDGKRYIDTIDGDKSDPYLYANKIRLATMKEEDSSESTINAKEVWQGKSQVTGNTTDKNNFIYNEGASKEAVKNLGNQNNDYSIKGSDGKETSFFDKNLATFQQKQLTAVRQL